MFYITENSTILVNTEEFSALAALLNTKSTKFPLVSFHYSEVCRDFLNDVPEDEIGINSTWQISAKLHLLESNGNLIEITNSKNQDKIKINAATYGKNVLGKITDLGVIFQSSIDHTDYFDSLAYTSWVETRKEKEKTDKRAREWLKRWVEINQEIYKIQQELESKQPTLSVSEETEELNSEDLADVDADKITLEELFLEKEALIEKINKLTKVAGVFEADTKLVVWPAVYEAYMVQNVDIENLNDGLGVLTKLIKQYGKEFFEQLHFNLIESIKEFFNSLKDEDEDEDDFTKLNASRSLYDVEDFEFDQVPSTDVEAEVLQSPIKKAKKPVKKEMEELVDAFK